MKKRIFLTVFCLLALAGTLGAVKALQIERMVEQGRSFTPPPVVVTTATAKEQQWETRLTSVGTLEAVQGVTVMAEVPGKVVKITFEPGARVDAGSLLVLQDTAAEEAQLRSVEAGLALAQLNLDRSRALLAQKAISRSQFDSVDAAYKQAQAQADELRAAIAKKTIRAPFSGRLGLRKINLGQILEGGEPIVSLQTLDPIFVNFELPQQDLARVEPGLTVRIAADAVPGAPRQGKITAINAQVDPETRNVQIQGTIANPDGRLRPGMFVEVAVVLPAAEPVLAIPATAVSYAPYSDSVFVVEERPAKKGGEPIRIVRQKIVQIGEKRGDFISVLTGLNPGETVVSTGLFKLRNEQPVVVDNTLAPAFKLSPEPEDS
jgi:membrane fusion protein (multidrug efflux system)